MMNIIGNNAYYGFGSAHGHHGELLQGAFMSDGRIARGLVTLPCPMFQTQARARLCPGSDRVVISPSWKRKAARAAAMVLRELELTGFGADVHVVGNIPTARGFGSSTADVIATARAVVDAAGDTLPDSTVARIAVEAEGASDPLMIDGVVLFAQREGRTLEQIGRRLPPLEVVGFFTGDASSTGIDTLALPPARYSPAEIARFDELRTAFDRAVREDDPFAVGSVAAESAWINQAHLPVARLEWIQQVAGQVGAAGIQVAHSGDIAGLLFDGSDPGLDACIIDACARLRRLGIEQTWRFNPRVASYDPAYAAS
jgi:uncharacterized protein involved in propanediol utilization